MPTDKKTDRKMLTAKQWKRKIRKMCESAGTYRAHFEPVIETLASIMETRDRAHVQYVNTGALPVVPHTNKNGSTNMVKNPALAVSLECDAQALSYWRDLGLTPAGYKKLSGSINTGGNSFEDLLGNIDL